MEQTVSSIEHYLQLIKEHKKQRAHDGKEENFLFRGQAIDNPLMPKLLRPAPKGELLESEQELFSEFKRANPLLIDSYVVDDWDFLTLGQHFGLPTRLLDWSNNALTALWFASDKEIMEKESQDFAVVWMLMPEPCHFVNPNRSSPFDVKEIKLYKPRIIKQRINNQSGVFSIHSNEALLSRLSLNESDSFAPSLVKITIPREYVDNIRNDLNTLGVNAFSIFPELEGLCTHLRWKFF